MFKLWNCKKKYLRKKVPNNVKPLSLYAKQKVKIEEITFSKKIELLILSF